MCAFDAEDLRESQLNRYAFKPLVMNYKNRDPLEWAIVLSWKQQTQKEMNTFQAPNLAPSNDVKLLERIMDIDMQRYF